MKSTRRFNIEIDHWDDGAWSADAYDNEGNEAYLVESDLNTLGREIWRHLASIKLAKAEEEQEVLDPVGPLTAGDDLSANPVAVGVSEYFGIPTDRKCGHDECPCASDEVGTYTRSGNTYWLLTGQ